MNRYLLALMVLMSSVLRASAQHLILSSEAINATYKGPSIKSIRPHWSLSPVITVKFSDGRKEKVAKSSVWGYQDRKGRIYRYYKHEFYRVVKVTDLVYYSIRRPSEFGESLFRYFSKDLDAPLRWTRAKARREYHAGR